MSKNFSLEEMGLALGAAGLFASLVFASAPYSGDFSITVLIRVVTFAIVAFFGPLAVVAGGICLAKNKDNLGLVTLALGITSLLIILAILTGAIQEPFLD